MSSPESYRARYPESAKKKLFNPRDIEGSPNIEIFENSQLISKGLSKYPEFVGLTLHGSRLKGYSTPESDTDVSLWVHTKMTHDAEDVMLKDFQEITKSLPNYGEGPVQILYINPEKMKILVENAAGGSGGQLRDFLIGPSIGPHIEEYKQILKQEFQNLNGDQQEVFLNTLADDMIGYEELKEKTVKARVQDTEDKFDEILSARRELWKKHISRMMASSK